MKKFFSFIIVICFAVAGVFSSCVDPNNPDGPVSQIPGEMSAKVVAGSEEYSKVDVQLTTLNIAVVAYAHATNGKDLSKMKAEEIFELAKEKGHTATVKDGKNLIHVTGLEAATTSTIYFVGVKTDNFYHDDLVTVKVTTQGFDENEELTIFDVDYRSISLHLNWPEDKVAPGNVLKWGYTDLAMHNYNGGAGTEWDALDLHDEVYHNWFDGDKTFYLNEDHRWLSYTNEESVAESIALHGAVVAGQPGYFMLGEFQYSDVDFNLRAGWGPGYYIPYFALNEGGGYFRKEFIQSKKPEVMRAKPEVTVNLTPKGTGTISIVPTDDIYMYAYALVEDSVYYGDMMKVLGNDTSYVQWFVTSETGFYLLMGNAAYAPVTIIAEDNYYLRRNTTYHLCITSYSDEVGSRQSYHEVTFQLPQSTLPDPTCEVAPAELPADTPEAEKPYLVAFNIKCPTKDADEVRYIANYERDWESMRRSLTKQGYSTEEADAYLVESYGGEFTATEIEQINSDEGYTITIPTREDSVTYLGAICYNVDGSPSVVSVTKTRSMMEPALTPTTSPLFESLKGKWHVKVPVAGQRYVDNVITPFKVYAEFDVTIGDVGYEETLPEEAYNLFYNGTDLLNKADVDAVFEQFKSSVDTFNQKNKNQNRLLIQGFDLAQPVDGFSHKFDDVENVSYTAYRDPYSLFISKDYSGYNYESPVYDFGPKLYLEFDQEGNITVPFNVNYFAPAAQWFEHVFYLIGSNSTNSLPYVTEKSTDENGKETSAYVTGHFPVEVSADGNTFKIKGLKYGESEALYYPALGATDSTNSGYSVPCSVINDVVFTRITDASAAPLSTRAAFEKVNDVIPATVTSKYKATPLSFKSHTAAPANIVAPQRVKMNVVTSEQFKERADERSRQLGYRR